MLSLDKLVLDYLYFAAGGLREAESEKLRRIAGAPQKKSLRAGDSKNGKS